MPGENDFTGTDVENQLRSLKQQRGFLKAKLTRFRTFVYETYHDENDVEQLKTRLSKNEHLLEQFEGLQLKIDVLTDAEDVGTHLQDFEDAYYKVIAAARTIINSVNASSSGVSSNQMSSVSRAVSSLKLPSLTLPNFAGEYNQWSTFKDSFISAVDSDDRLGDVQKLQYLRGCLKGEALALIGNLVTNNQNYKIAWDLLVERFQNKRLIIQSHLKALLEIQSITKDNQMTLRQFVDTIKTQVRALEAWNLPINQWDTILIYLYVSKLDFFTRKEWETELSQKDGDYLPTLEFFLKFLNNKCGMLEMLERSKPNQQTKRDFGVIKKVTNVATASHSCNYCKNVDHVIYKCKQFLDLTIEKRFDEARKLKLCFNCLRIGHSTNSCKLPPCRICRKYHNSLLHTNVKLDKLPETGSNEHQLSTISNFAKGNASYVLLATASVKIKDSAGNMQGPYTCLLDPGSQMNFITHDLCKHLQLKREKADVTISGINQYSSRVTQKARVNLLSRMSSYKTSFDCLVIPKITEVLPQIKLNLGILQVPKGIKLADTNFWVPKSVDLLIGAELFWELLEEGQQKLENTGITLQQTKLGWVASGKTYNLFPPVIKSNFNGFSQMDFELQHFWELEEVQDVQIYSKEEQECEEHFAKTVEREKDGRYRVALPIKDGLANLGDSRKIAYKRLLYLERRFQREPNLMEKYELFLEDYASLGHMKKVEDCFSQKVTKHYYLPHHPVIRDDSLTTKLRVVFDASAKTTSGHSLNDILMVGPKTQSDLFDMVLRFRFYPIVLSADITMMYRQINVRQEDQGLQRILWRNSKRQEIDTYELTTVTYGTASAPFLATRCLKQLAMDEEENYPEASQILKNDFYMDDLLTGVNSPEEGCYMRKQLSELLEKGKFKLRKWRSNCMLDFENEDYDSLLVLDKETTRKTLGLYWNANDDNLQFSVKLENSGQMTKRTILRKIAKIFDPLGLLGPIVVTAKMFMQKLWLEKLDWDEPISDNLSKFWIDYYTHLDKLNDLKIPRRVHLGKLEDEFDIMAFCDASEKVYGACFYVRNVNSTDGDSRSRLLCSKSKVAPLKTISLPRLELNGAYLLCKLLKNVKRALGTRIRKVYCFTDSTIVLAWIKTEPNVLKTYVANRVAEIQTITKASDWYHVQSKMNPADLLSRGCLAINLKDAKLWWNGPDFLNSNQFQNEISNQNFTVPELLELKTVTLMVIENNLISSLLEKFSTYLKLKRVIAYCFRFWNNCKNKLNRQAGALSIQEIDHSSKIIIKLAQRQMYPNEIQDLENGKPINRKSKLLNLNPFLDEEGFLRVGGRIDKASIPENHKHPIILAKHRLTWLILTEHHVKLHHAGVDVILSYTRTKFWPIGGRSFIKRIIKSCLRCFRFRPRPLEQLMGNLPKFRLQPTDRPFVHTAVDFAGPINIKESKRRGRPITGKAYVSVFVCLVTRAVHLECVTELTTQAFMAALRRFTARRGLCSIICSDNGTNFVGTNKELKKIYEFLYEHEDEIITDAATRQINWKFLPPRSPHFGGLHEAAVKCFKRHFYKVTQGLLLTFEECCTLLAEIEVCLNSRPLTKISDDPNDISVITPSHFLIGDTPMLPMEYDLLKGPANLLKRWQHIQRVRQHFWQRWQREYLHHLQTRSKWNVTTDNPRVGDLVLLAEDNLPPLRWAMGRVVKLHPGDDGLVRVVSVRAKQSVFKRPITKVCMFPNLDSEQI